MKLNRDIQKILDTFANGGLEVAIVGGAVRDLLLGNEVSDWDLTTNAKPEEILKLFKKAFYNNVFGTVGISVSDADKPSIVQITTYRKEEKYTDSRHPDVIVWGNNLEEDLARRDFTINAMALRLRSGQALRFSKTKTSKSSNIHFSQENLLEASLPMSNFQLVDPFGGQSDLKKKIIKTVGDADSRFREDALRLLRAIRFAATLGFSLEKETFEAIKKNAQLLKKISGERIRDELLKIIESENAASGIFLARDAGILTIFLPELDVCFNVEQKSPKRHHVFDVGTHCVMSLRHCPSKDAITRFATLLHDIGKEKVANMTEEGVRTFYNHEVIGGRQAATIAKRLNLSKIQREKLFKLVRFHQFTVDEKQTDKALRRFIKNIGVENIENMMDLRIGDRLGGGLQQPESWRLKLFRQRLKEVMKKPFTVSDLKINGHDVMKILNLKPGPGVGKVLSKLFEEVSEDSKKNTKEYLLLRVVTFKKNSTV